MPLCPFGHWWWYLLRAHYTNTPIKLVKGTFPHFLRYEVISFEGGETLQETIITVLGERFA